MADRLTQLQICLDQLVEQFNATVNYVNANAEPALLDDDPTSVSNMAAKAPVPGQQQQQQQQQQPQAQNQQSQSHSQMSPNEGSGGGGGGSAQDNSNNASNKASNMPSVLPNNQHPEQQHDFENTINELSTDIILKSRQISMLIDSLPGIGVSPESQLQLMQDLSNELKEIELQRIKKIEEKDKLLKWCEELIAEMATGISESRR
ncbi:SRB7 [[Candida] subhashii]|uniref:Mediator of RNA polymerase II transcription subunit 21 n=1 Tax=[Candida] subhashii TaxID=561895 RepID=A0A8J5UN05_9ASCO|nr:SRB7 [[Candida] subhashii]KAG7666348.1 SRB7 [[Candida] subhashii]